MSDTDENNFQLYGNLLEPYEDDEVPKKKAFTIEDQIATDDQGRRRFHGAFTGGFSAGFFNTVGSLEGWKPSEFKSSRSEKAEQKLQKPQDFMDDEDIGQFGIAPTVVRATSDYSSLKRNKIVKHSDGPIPGIPVLHAILQPAKETVGILLLRKMGWKPGQGVGPRITKQEKKRINRENKTNKVYGCEIPEQFRSQIHSDNEISSDDDTDITFAPDDYDPFIYKPKDNTFGMGYIGLDKRPILSSHINLFGPSEFKMQDHKNKKISISGQAFGVGAFENEDEDIYAKEDMSKYDFQLDPLAKKLKVKSKKEGLHKEQIIDGFVLAKNPAAAKKSFPPPILPKNFIPKHGAKISRFEPLPETHRMYSFDRTKNMGRHDLTAEQRSKILNSDVAIITTTQENQTVNKEFISQTLKTSDQKEKELIKEKALKITEALPSTSVGPFKPFMSNPEKQKRYEEYLSLVKLGQEDKLADIQPANMSKFEAERENFEFAQAARMFKPITGLVFNKFVAASSSDDSLDPMRMVGKSVYEHGTSEMREAAKNKIFGQLTRNIEVWRPNKLLCKRFNVPDPNISETEMTLSRKKKNKFSVFDYYESYQQNNLVKEGPKPKQIIEEETKNDENEPKHTSSIKEIDPSLSKCISFETSCEILTQQNDSVKKTFESKEIVEETKEDESKQTLSNKQASPYLVRHISMESSCEKVKPDESRTNSTNYTLNDTAVNVLNKVLIIPSTSSSIPIIQPQKSMPEESPKTNVYTEQSTLLAPVPLPTDPKKRKDLFKAIFLSSSDESEDENSKKEDKKPEEAIIEMKKILLEKEPEKSAPKVLKPNKGIFADLDWNQINKNITNNTYSSEQKNYSADNSTEENKNKKIQGNNNEKRDENIFGPQLPSQIPKQTNESSWKPMFTNKSVEDSDLSSSDNEWIEVNSFGDKSNKKSSKKHKKHKKDKFKRKHKKNSHKR